MPEYDHRPLVEDYEDSHQKVEGPTQLDMENLENDLKGAVDTEGPEIVADALAQLATGHAHSQELMAWIDDLRDPTPRDPEPVTPDGFLHDFEADTERAGGALDDPTGMQDDAPPIATDHTDTSGGDDDDYFFSATRKRKLGGDDDDDEGDAPADGEVKPAAVKASKVKTTKNP